MKDLSISLARVLIYLEARTNSHSDDDDIQVLEEVMAQLNEAPEIERAALRNALISLESEEMLEGLGLLAE